MISIRGLRFQYKGAKRLALDTINLDIADGDFVGIIGTSGAGKSTLTYALNGIVPHHFTGDFYGQVLVDGMDSVDSSPEQLSAKIGSVFQDIDAQMVALLVEDEMAFGLENFGVPRAEIGGRIDDALAMVGIGPLRYRMIRSLSGGEKQKVAIAAIVALRPSIVLLDEPTGELDPQSSRQIFSMLRELNERFGLTIVVVEQKIMLLCEFVRKLVVMEQGRIAHAGAVREVLAHSDEMEAIGVNVPRVVTLANRLRAAGLYAGPLPLNIDEAEVMLKTILSTDYAD